MAIPIDAIIDWKLDLVTWDVVIPLERVRGPAAVAQRIGILLRMIRGEWFANMRAGMPWFPGNGVDPQAVILGQAFAEVRTRAEVRKIIESVEGVDKITQLSVTFVPKPRRAKIRWRVTTVWGDTLADELDKPLV